MSEAERAVLSSIMRDNSLYSQYRLDADDFEDVEHKILYGEICRLIESGQPADCVTLADFRKISVDALIAVVEATTVNFVSYYRMVRDAARLRRARQKAAELQQVQSADDIEKIAAQLTELLREQGGHSADQNKSVADAITYLESLENGEKPGYATGFAKLDNLLGGFQPSDLVVIGARSQHGKTALMMNMANNIAAEHAVGIISGEQPHVQLGMRSLAAAGDVSLAAMRRGKLTADDWSRIGAGARALHDNRVFIYDRANPSITDIEVQARQWAHYSGVKVVFVDFLQLVTGGAGEEHRLQIGDVARRLKGLAKACEITVVALAQVARAIDSKPEGPDFMGRMPYTFNLADSAKIEDAADQIITLYRPEVYFPKVERIRGVAFLNICKNRHGPIGYVRIGWKGEYVRFEDEVQAA